MAFPFAFVPGFRQQLILAIGTSSLASVAAYGCESAPRRTNEQAPGQQQTSGADAAPMKPVASSAGTSASTGGSKSPGMPSTTAGKTAAGGAPGSVGGSGTLVSGASGVGVSGTSGAGVSGGSLSGAGVSGASGVGVSGMSGSGGHAGVSAPMCMFQTERTCFPRAQMESQVKFGCGMIANPPARFSDAEVQQHFLPNGCAEGALACNSCCNPAVSEGEPQADGSCCYTFCAGSCCGRPLIVGGYARLAELGRRSDWLQAFAGDVHWDARIAREWLEDARMEHASIASFARFALDLLAYGAPSELVELAQRAGLDEIEHARMCFGLAARYGASESGPGPLSAAGVSVAPSLFHAACAAFDEGCIGETLAALQAQAALERARDPQVRRVLAQIAQQEAAHAELAWRFVSWAATRLGARLTRELHGRFTRLMLAPVPIAEREPADTVASLHAAGRLTVADKHRVTLEGMRDVIAPCVAALKRANAERETCQPGAFHA